MTLICFLKVLACLIFLIIAIKIAYYFYSKIKRESEYRKNKIAKEATEKSFQLIDEITDKFCSASIPRMNDPEWLVLFKRCIRVDFDCEKIGLKPKNATSLFFLQTFRRQEEARLEAIEHYNLCWRQLLQMIRNMNFPQKENIDWDFLLVTFSVADFDYLKYVKEKGELENTLRRLVA